MWQPVRRANSPIGIACWVFAAVVPLYGALDRRASPLALALRSLVTVRVWPAPEG